jgi:two-component system sensor histidine kinase/response regulator
MNGFEATAAIRDMEKKMGGHIPIIALTANAMKEDEALCLASGMDYFISKPLRMIELISMVERIPSSGRKINENQKPSESVIHSKEKIIEDMDGDESLLQTIVGLCIEDLPRHAMSLRESIHQNDAKKLEITAHTIKGMAKQFGGHTAGDIAFQLEQKGKKNDFTETETLLPKLLKELDILMLAFKDLVK